MAQSSDKEAASPDRRTKRRWVPAVVLGLVLLLGIGAGGTFFYAYRALQPAPAGDPVIVEIPSGARSSTIAKLLEKNGIIRHSAAFTFYLKYNKEGSRFQAGTYELAPGMTNQAIVAKLNQGDTLKEEVLRFTIPEGFTVAQIADKLSRENAVNKDAFLQLADGAKDWHSSWAAQIPEQSSYRHRLEGYLFPETYELKKGSTERDILERMLAETDRKLIGLPEGWQSRLAELKLSFHQMLTAASLIEREVSVDEERPVVAGVIYNRLKRDMPLQIDATVQYLFDKQKERLLEKDLQIESPYNTYLNPGLPPGPIASPSLASIKAALYPADTRFLFYVTKKDGSGRHLFAETFEEHKKNIEKSKSGG